MFIDDMYTHDLGNDAHFQFNKAFDKLLNQHDGVLQRVRPLYDLYAPLFAEEDSALKKIRKSQKTRLIHEADRARDVVYYGLRGAIRSALRHLDNDIFEAAERLQILLKTYGDVTQKPMNAQTSLITNILQDFKGRYAPDVAAINAGYWVTELEARNNAFDSLMHARYDEAVDRVDISVKDARARVNEAYKNIIRRLNSIIDFENPPAFQPFAVTMNEIIVKYSLLRRKNSRKRKAQEGKKKDT